MTEDIKQQDILDPAQQMSASLILFASKRIFFIYSLIFALLISIAVLSLHGSPIISVIMIAFFVMPFSFFALHLVTNGYRLEITDQGLALTYFARTQTIRWADVKDIRAGWIAALDAIPFGFNKKLFVRYRREGRDRSLTIWPIYFGISAREMTNFLVPYCRAYPKLIEALLADS